MDNNGMRKANELFIDAMIDEPELLVIHLQDAIDSIDAEPEVAKAMLRNIKAALAAPTPDNNGWRDIETMGEPVLGKRFWLAAYIVPSQLAQENGSKPHWDVADGIFLGGRWTGILGGKPSHYMPYDLPPPPALDKGE